MRRIATRPTLLLRSPRSPPLGASDHLDGPVTTGHRATELTDRYAFPTPNRAGVLTLLLDAYTAVAPDGHFSDKVDDTLHVRRAQVRQGDRPGFDTSDEVAILCTFVLLLIAHGDEADLHDASHLTHTLLDASG